MNTAQAQARQKLAGEMNPNMIGAGFNGRYESPKKAVRPLGVNFIGSATSFANEIQMGQKTIITINNTGENAVDKTVCLFPGHFTSASALSTFLGVTIDGILTDGTIVAASVATNDDVTGSVTPTNAEALKAYLNKCPTRFPRFQFRVNDDAQIYNDWNIVRVNPFVGKTPSQVTPSTFAVETANNTKLVTFYQNDFQIDDQSIVYLTINAGVSMTITMFPGATVNNATELAEQARMALEAGEYNHELLNKK